MGVILAPILEGKLDAWKAWTRELEGAQKDALADFNRRYGLTRHAAWLTETPGGPAVMTETPGGPAVIALHEGPGADDLMPKLGSSQIAFDISFKERLKELHGMDVTQPPPGPMPELYLDSSGG